MTTAPAQMTTSVNVEAVERLRSWLRTTTDAGPDVAIEMDTDLIGEGVLDSLQMVNFLLFIEEIRGEEIPEALIQPNNFTSLRVIHDTFFRS